MISVPFEVFREPAAMRARAEDLRRDGRIIAVVPTMGALHEGHLELVRQARARADVVILTIFVNPTQFGPTEDLSRYPRDEAGDLAQARAAGIDLAFCPDAAAMYPAGAQTFVEVRELQRPLCGASRPGHFAGVATIVAKLFHITRPHLAVFGEKDYQQLAVVRAVVRELLLPVEIVGLPTVREADGVAMSSRNQYLTPAERALAPRLYQALQAAAREGAAVDAPLPAIEAYHTAALNDAGFRVEYFRFRNAQLAPPAPADGRRVVLTAAWLGKARLIDNHPFDVARGQGTPG